MKTLLVTILFLLTWATGASGQVAVIAHKSVPLDSIKKNVLLDFYARDIKKWSDGQPIIVFDLKPQSEAKTTFYNFLGRSPSRMKSVWLKKLLSGEGDPPEAMSSEEALLAKVAATAGAIGFVSKTLVRDSVKVLLEINEEKN